MTNDNDAARWRYKKPREEIEAALRRQVSNLRRSAGAFDQGALEEAERLAASVYVLCNDGGKNSRSLLAQLGLRDRMRFPDTASAKTTGNPYQIDLSPPLLVLWKSEKGVSLRPPLDAPTLVEKMQWRPFSRWWDQRIFQAQDRRVSLSRKGLVFFLRSQDGGAHVDGELKGEAYHRLSRENDTTTWNDAETMSGRVGVKTENLHWLTMRQVTWELDAALQRAGF